MFLGQFYEMCASVRERNIKLFFETVIYRAITGTVTCIITIETVTCIMHCGKYHLYNLQQSFHLLNYNKNCHPHIRFRNCNLDKCKNF